jgi:hypothetical protein
MPEPKFLFYSALALLAFVALLSPILVSAALALAKGKGVRGRWLFLFVAPILAYTILWVLTLVFIVPATVVVVFLAPATQDLFNKMPYWYGIAAWMTEYQLFLAAGACGNLAAWLAVWLWPRWPNILFALTLPPGTEITNKSSVPRSEA